MRSNVVVAVVVAVVGWLLAAGVWAGDPDRGLRLLFEGEGAAEWFVPTPGFGTGVEEGVMRLSPTGEAQGPFGNVMTMVTEVEAWRGRRAVLTARVRVEGDAGHGQMWLRVDRPGQRMGAFDNMGDRPVRPGGWTEARIEVEIDRDAQAINLGFMSMDGATVLAEGVRLVAVGEARPVQPASDARTLSDRERANVAAAARLLALVWLFDPGDEARDTAAWGHLGVRAMEEAEGAADAADLAARLERVFASVSPALQVWAGEAEDAGPVPAPAEGATIGRFWRHTGAGRAVAGNAAGGGVYRSVLDAVSYKDTDATEDRAGAFWTGELADGVWCRLGLWADLVRGRSSPRSDEPGLYRDPDALPVLTDANRATRLAGVAMAWGVLEHFYPYFDVVDVDWDGVLTDALAAAAAAPDSAAYERTLRRMIAQLDDGHGELVSADGPMGTVIPLRLAWAGEDLVVVGRAGQARGLVGVGDVLVSIDARSAEACHQAVSVGISAATEGWRRVATARRMVLDLETPDAFEVVLRGVDGRERMVTLERGFEWAQDERGPAPTNGSEPAPGVVYFDLNGASEAELEEHLERMSGADAVVFDLRGYPSDGAYRLIAHLIDAPVRSPRWMVPLVTRPGGEGWDWSEAGRWLIAPREPRIRGEVVFLTGAGAISYAESIMGIVEHERLGTIVGSPTAGTNGNVHQLELPGGSIVLWTGMRVLKHDGSRHHGVGIRPHVEAVATAAGIAAGRDEVLERGVAVARERIGANARENGPP